MTNQLLTIQYLKLNIFMPGNDLIQEKNQSEIYYRTYSRKNNDPTTRAYIISWLI